MENATRMQDHRGAGKRLLDMPGYRFPALGSSLPAAMHLPLALWRYYNGGTDGERVIKELRQGFSVGDGGCLNLSAWRDHDQTGRSDSDYGLAGGGCGTKS